MVHNFVVHVSRENYFLSDNDLMEKQINSVPTKNAVN